MFLLRMVPAYYAASAREGGPMAQAPGLPGAASIHIGQGLKPRLGPKDGVDYV
jgi:hypothetical protein